MDTSEQKGYHMTKIPKGDFGQVSKIIEEALELEDAEKQNNAILCLCELSDLYGAFIGYLENKFPQFKLIDIQKMSEATNRAFLSGQRVPRTTPANEIDQGSIVNENGIDSIG